MISYICLQKYFHIPFHLNRFLLIPLGEAWGPFHEQHRSVCIAGTPTHSHPPTKHSCYLKGVAEETKTFSLKIVSLFGRFFYAQLHNCGLYKARGIKV